MTPKRLIIIGLVMLLAPIWFFVFLLLSGSNWRAFIYHYERFGSYFSEFRNIFPSECEMALTEMESSSQLLQFFCDARDTVADDPFVTATYAVSIVGALVLLVGFMKSKNQRHESR